MTTPRYVLDSLAETVGVIADAIGGPGAAELRADAPRLVGDADSLAARIDAAIAAAETLEHLDALADSGPSLDAVPETTAHRRTQSRAQAALVALVRELAAIEVASRSAVASYADRSALLAARDRSLGLIDDVSATATDATHTAMRDLRAALVEHLAGRAPALARVITTEELSGLPSLVASYRLFGDIESADDIAARNRLARPGFIPAGPIEVAIRD